MNELKSVITDYENGLIDYDQAQTMILQLTGKNVEQYQLDSYWGAESLESFINRLLIDPIMEWQYIDDQQALALIEEILKNEMDGAILERNGQALEKRYGKPEGMISECIFHRAIHEAKLILSELKKETRIIL
jgi:hypothetical protein